MANRRTRAADVTRAAKAITSVSKALSSMGEAAEAPLGTELAEDDVVLFASHDDLGRDAIRLGFLIHDVSRMRRSAYDQFMKPLGITRAQWWVLAHLSRHDGMMQTQLADVLEVGKASLGDVIESLEGGGWVQRRPDPSDKRAKRVFLTKPAQSLIKRMTVLEHEFNSKILADLTPAERSELGLSLSKIKRAITRFAPTAVVATDEG